MVILRDFSENDSVWFGLGKIMTPGLFVVWNTAFAVWWWSMVTFSLGYFFEYFFIYRKVFSVLFALEKVACGWLVGHM